MTQNSFSEMSLSNKIARMGIAYLNLDGEISHSNQVWESYFSRDLKESEFYLINLEKFTKLEFRTIVRQIQISKQQVIADVELMTLGNSFHWQIVFDPKINNNGLVSSILACALEVSFEEATKNSLKMRMEDRANKLQAVFDVIAVATEAHEKELGTVLQGCLEQVIDSTYASGGAIQLLDADGDYLELHAHAGLEKEIVTEMQESSAESGLFGWAASHQEQLVLRDLTSDWRTSEVIRNSDVNVYAGVPMNAEGELVGVLSIFREKKRAFSPDDISILASIADQIGVIISNHRLRAENDRLVLLEERNRLARELHDAVTQSLYSSVLLTEALKVQAGKQNISNVEQIAEQLQTNAHQALKEMRLLIHNLRPSILSSVGLIRAIRHRLKAVEERAGVSHHFSVSGDIKIPKQIEEALYFVVQEALNNALKHAKSSFIEVSIDQSNSELVIIVRDEGCGFDPNNLDEGGLGLISMQERIHQINGELDILSELDQGTSIKIRWEGKL